MYVREREHRGSSVAVEWWMLIFRSFQSLLIWILEVPSLPNNESGREFNSAGWSLALKRSPRYLEPFYCHLPPLNALKSLWLQLRMSVLFCFWTISMWCSPCLSFLGEVKTGEYSEIISVSARGSGVAGAAPQEGPWGERAAGLSNESSAKQHWGSEQGEGEAGRGLQEFGEEIVPNQKVRECLSLQRLEGMGKCLNVCLL